MIDDIAACGNLVHTLKSAGLYDSLGMLLTQSRQHNCQGPVNVTLSHFIFLIACAVGTIIIPISEMRI